MRPRTAPAILLVLALTSSVAAGELDEDGAAAPVNGWTTDGGCPSRSGVTRTAPLSGPPRVAWDRTVKGAIQGEPLVSGNWIVVAVQEKPDLHALLLLRLSDGGQVSRKAFRTRSPLRPQVWRSTVIVHAGSKQLEAHRIVGRSLQRFWRVEAGVTVDSMVAFGREVYVRDDGALERWNVGSRKRAWRTEGNWRGRLALRGNHVYVAEYSPGLGKGHLRLIDRANGRKHGDGPIGHHDGKIPGTDADMRIAIHSDKVLVHHALAVPTATGGTANLMQLGRTITPGGQVNLVAKGLFDLRGGAVPWKAGWLAVMRDRSGLLELSLSQGTGTRYVLATNRSRPDLFKGRFLPSLAGGVAYFGAGALDVDGSRLLWTLREAPDRRPVPARDTILLVHDRSRLVALRAERAPAAPPWTCATAFSGEPPIVRGRIALRDGSVVRGTFSRADEGRALVCDGKRAVAPWPLVDVLAGEDEGGRLVFSADGEDALRGLTLLAERDLGRELAGLATRAGLAKDVEMLERLLGEAWSMGASPTETKRPETELKRLHKRNKPPTADAGRVAKVLDSEAAVRAAFRGFLWDRFGKLPADVSP
ncbi:MAG: hypothetical protein O7E54_00255, partial [Planctomycetota bacterium]|nr:hypothetical protein [Planctomycetota bacterium]